VPEEVSILDRRTLTRLFPVLRIVAAVRLAFDFRKLTVAVVGLALLQFGWMLLDSLVPAAADATPDVFGSALPGPGVFTASPWSIEGARELGTRLAEPIRCLTGPLLALVKPGRDWREIIHALFSLVWLILVWGVCGGAIARIALVQIAKMRQTGIAESLRFALKNAGPLVIAPLCPLLGLAFCATVGAGFGLLYRVPLVGPALAGVILILPLAAGLVMALLLAGLVAGWPLLQAAVAGGAEDSLDALSRIFGYLNQRLGPYAVLLVFVWLEGIVGLALVDFFAGGVIRLTHWSLGLTAPSALLTALFDLAGSSTSTIAGAIHALWIALVRLLAHAWIYSYLWTVAACVYLWLRQDVDGTPWSEIDPPGVITPAPP
jgi:hypothetical protein